MDRKDENYYKQEPYGDAPYLNDLLRGKLRIYDVPLEYRSRIAYVYAMRWARDACSKEYAYMEKKLIEHILLNDIIETYKRGDPRYRELYWLHGSYYDPNGSYSINGVGIDLCASMYGADA